MAPLTKELMDGTISAGESQATPASAVRPASTHLRSDALSLEVPIKVHGSKVTQVVREITPHTEPFEEQTTTMIVFPRGGVLKMSTAVAAGQMLVVTNLRSKQDAICRILKVRTFSNSQAYVEVEFTHRQPGYWGVYFPSDGPAGTHSQPAGAPVPQPHQPAASAIESIAPPAADSRPAAPEAKAPARTPAVAPPASSIPPAIPRPKPEGAFAHIGSHEDVLPPAAATTLKVTPPPASRGFGELSTGSLPAETHGVPAVSIQDLRGDGHSAPAAISDASASRSLDFADAPARLESPSIFGSFSGGATQLRTAASEGTESRTSAPALSRSRNWLLLAGIAVACAALGGAAIYFRMIPAKPAATLSNAAVTSAAGTPSANSPAVAGLPGATSPAEAGPNAPLKPSAVVRARAEEPSVAKVSETAKTPEIAKTDDAQPARRREPAHISEPAAAPPQPASAFASGVLSTKLNAHPRTVNRAANAGQAPPPLAAPQISGGPSGAAFSGILSSTNAAPPPMPVPSGPVRVGGQVREPRVISRVIPVYPIGAKSSRVEGDVVMDILIGKDGKVSSANVISGPALLRQAALDAVRRWKYEPSKLDGEPIAIQTHVTIGFHL